MLAFFSPAPDLVTKPTGQLAERLVEQAGATGAKGNSLFSLWV